MNLRNELFKCEQSIRMQAKIKDLARSLFSMLGFEISKKLKCINSLRHSVVRPLATYSPWRTDVQFQQTYKIIQPYTLVDQYRCYELWCLVEQSSKLCGGNIIEIGVWRGGTGALIAKRAQESGIPGEVFLCDTFAGLVKVGARDPSYKGGEHANASRQVVEKLMKEMDLENVKLLEGIFPDQTGSEVEHLQFRFCHIDVDVYQSAHDIMAWIWKKIVRGGIVVYDDYGFSSCSGITQYVNEQIPCKDRIVIHNLNGHAVIIKL